MTTTEIQQLIQNKLFPDQPESVEVVETHTAWVLLTEQYAYKIKKPVQFSFLDFSTLDKRHFYCERELILNRRLAPYIYLKVWPVRQQLDQIFIGSGTGTIIDYCLQMKRMDSSREMDKLLAKDQVTEAEVREIALEIAAFHKKADIIIRPYNEKQLINDFADILSVTAIVETHVGAASVLALDEAVQCANRFLSRLIPRLAWRQQNGYVRDVHGDLHSGNIFLLDTPVIFDCIEFGDAFRQIDLLNEIAFLCMDLEHHGKAELSDAFLNTYLAHSPCIHNEEDRQLLLFFKWYRAGIRLKVSCLKLHEGMEAKEREKAITQIQQYYYLFGKYFEAVHQMV
jgi:uncharacterized protein